MEIYAIELTSRCNLRCHYCPQPSMQRAKEDMPLEVFEKTLDYPFWKDVVAGHLFGEALLHPDLIDITRLCYERGLAFGFSTNAVLLEMDYLKKLIDAGLAWIMISFHIPRAKDWVEAIQKAFPKFPVLSSTLEIKHDWAGQVTSRRVVNYANLGDCIFHTYNLVSISAQGEILPCCIDVEARHSMGSLFDLSPEAFVAKENKVWFDLCAQCHMRDNPENLDALYAAYQGMGQKIHHYYNWKKDRDNSRDAMPRVSGSR
ncbi:MAG TPA: hypothetical protein DCM38_06355 [Gammaproteobacteria bacterium]|nr:hypothetical protein [Gammaproteobacteria bacterium]